MKSLLLSFLFFLLSAQTRAEWVQIPPEGFPGLLSCIESSIKGQFKYGRNIEFEVNEHRPLTDYVLVAKHLTLPEGASIDLIDGTSSYNKHKTHYDCPPNTYLIVADTIDIRGTAEIRALSQDSTVKAAPPRGKAPNGAGSSPNGADGDEGQAGFNGYDSPSLVIVARNFSGLGKLIMSLRGGKGGVGGKGQNGGDGTRGIGGNHASTTVFKCKRQPGDGGPGGNGGRGGIGGVGGQGGEGGNFIVITNNQPLKDVQRHFTVDIDGGNGGDGGSGGIGGIGGPGGNKGSREAYCQRTATPGPAGINGANGLPGAKGDDGLPGSIYFHTEDLIIEELLPKQL